MPRVVRRPRRRPLSVWWVGWRRWRRRRRGVLGRGPLAIGRVVGPCVGQWVGVPKILRFSIARSFRSSWWWRLLVRWRRGIILYLVSGRRVVKIARLVGCRSRRLVRTRSLVVWWMVSSLIRLMVRGVLIVLWRWVRVRVLCLRLLMKRLCRVGRRLSIRLVVLVIRLPRRTVMMTLLVTRRIVSAFVRRRVLIARRRTRLGGVLVPRVGRLVVGTLLRRKSVTRSSM